MSTYTEQDILERIHNMKIYRFDAQDTMMLKMYANIGDTLSDIPDCLLLYFPGKKDVCLTDCLLKASNHAADVTLKNRASNFTVSAVDNATGASPSSISYSVSNPVIHVTYPSEHSLPSAPQGFRLQVRCPDGYRKYVWVVDPA